MPTASAYLQTGSDLSVIYPALDPDPRGRAYSAPGSLCGTRRIREIRRIRPLGHLRLLKEQDSSAFGRELSSRQELLTQVPPYIPAAEKGARGFVFRGHFV